MEVLEQEYDQAVPVEKLTPHPENANVGAKGVIAESMEANGFYGACLVQKSTGYILAGNHRWQVAQEEGAETVPVLWLDVDDEHAKRIMAVDNPSNRAGYTDDERLARLLGSFTDLRGTGYKQDDLNLLLTKLAGQAVAPGEFKEFGADLPTDHTCPRCGYEWSGTTKRKESDEG